MRGRVERYHAAGRQAGGIGMNPFEVVEPEADVHVGRVVFGQVQLGPSHGPVEPPGIVGHRLRGAAGLRAQTGR